MTDPHPAAAPAAKAPAPRLDTRAPRPPVVRLRRGVVAAAVMGATGLLATSLAWAFVVQPELRAAGRDRVQDPMASRGGVRPSERVTEGPAGYGDLLPEPRLPGGGGGRATDAATAVHPASSRPDPAPRRRDAGAGEEARRSGLFFAASAGDGGGGGRTRDEGAATGLVGDRDYAATYNTHGLLAPLSPYEVKAGAVLPAVLMTGVDTARAGPVVATVTENVYDSVSGRHLLIPQGARLLGRHEGESRHGDKRAFLAWERLILPNGKSLVLTGAPGVDAEGRVGVEGRVDRRLLPLAVATVFAGAITALGQAAEDKDDRSGGLLGDVGDAAAIEAAQVGGKLIHRELAVRPQIRLRPGVRVRVLITRDLVLEPYRP